MSRAPRLHRFAPSLSIAHRSSPIAHRPSPIAHCPSSIAHRPSLIRPLTEHQRRPPVVTCARQASGFRSQPSALIPIAHRPSLIAHRPSLIAQSSRCFGRQGSRQGSRQSSLQRQASGLRFQPSALIYPSALQPLPIRAIREIRGSNPLGLRCCFNH